VPPQALALIPHTRRVLPHFRKLRSFEELFALFVCDGASIVKQLPGCLHRYRFLWVHFVFRLNTLSSALLVEKFAFFMLYSMKGFELLFKPMKSFATDKHLRHISQYLELFA
jgi:hypothetical protein